MIRARIKCIVELIEQRLLVPPKARKESTSPKPRSKSAEASVRKVEAVTKCAQNVKHAESANKNSSTSQAKKKPTFTKPRSKTNKVYVIKVDVVTEKVKSVESAEPVLKPVKYANVSKPYGPKSNLGTKTNLISFDYRAKRKSESCGFWTVDV